MSRNYSDSTLKKLFSLSGNICAFKSCNSKIIDEFESVIGVICHIEGEKPGSPRYNSNMTDHQRNNFENLILLCPTHHAQIDKNQELYSVSYLKEMKSRHENKYKNNIYEIPPKILDIVKVSVNTDEYSLERAHNYLNLSKALKNSETIKLWYEKFEYIFKWLKISSPIKNHERLMLDDIFERILQIKANDNKKFEDLLITFLDKIPKDEQTIYIDKVKSELESIVNSEFNNKNIRQIYKYLNKSNEETLTYLIDHAGSFEENDFNNFITDNLNLQQLAEDKQLFLFFEYKVWKMLDIAEKKKSNNQQINNLKNLINLFITINL
jgi:hypothetical protein